MVATFINARLPEDIEQGSQGGPEFLTTVLDLSGGGEKRNQEWEFPRITWDLSYGVQEVGDLLRIKSHFMVCAGRAKGFRFKDWSDFVIGDINTGDAQDIGVGLSGNTLFQIFKSYDVTEVDGSTIQTALKKITRIVNGTLKVYLDGVLQTETTDYTVDYDTGLITFIVGPTDDAVVSVYCEFDLPVRFDTDVMKLNMIWAGAGSVPPIIVKEIRE